MRFGTPSPAARYGAAVVLAAAAQLARLPLDPPTAIPFITFVPFMVLSAAYGGWGPGLLTTGLCVLESLYFAVEPAGSFGVRDPQNWLGIVLLASTGVVVSALFERLKRARRVDTACIAERNRAETSHTQLLLEMEARQRMLEWIIQHSPAAIALLRDPEFTFEMVNTAYEALAPGEPMVGRTVAEVWPEAASLVMPLLRVVRDAQTVYHATGTAVPMHRGLGLAVEERWLDFSFIPLPGTGDRGGVQILVVAIEMTERKKAEEALRAAYSELAAIHANAPVVLLVVDDDLRVEKVNDLAMRFAGRELQDMLGLRPGGAIGCLNALTDPRGCGHGPACGQCPVRLAVLDTLRRGTRHDSVEAWLPLFAGGRRQQQCLLVSTAAMEFNGTRKVLVCAQDMTEMKHAEEALHQTVRQLESALAEKTVLLKEVHHRVKNNLAVVSSLLSMKADTVGSSAARLALEESQQRVHSMALIHEHLYGNDHLDRVNFADYTRQLVERLYSAFAGEPGRISMETALAPVELGIEQAVPCALILNELLSNAFKYAFPEGRRGRILVSFRESGAGWLELAVEDDGIGLPAGCLSGQCAKSLGLRIVAILTNQLDGTLEQAACPGTRIVLRFPAGDGPASGKHRG